jgi:uncharacterized membrane protein YjfL (UPF0719 family)
MDTGFWGDLFEGVGLIAAYGALGLVLFLVGAWLFDWLTPGHLFGLIRERSMNAAVLAGSVLVGIAGIVAMAMRSSRGGWGEGLIEVAVWGMAGIVVQAVCTFGLRRALRADMSRVMHSDRLEPATVFLALGNLAVGLVTTVAVS